MLPFTGVLETLYTFTDFFYLVIDVQNKQQTSESAMSFRQSEKKTKL